MRIYACHQFGGLEENVEDVDNRLSALYSACGNILAEHKVTFYSPLHATGFLYHKVSWEEGMRMCIEELSNCDAVMLFGELSYSKGCMQERHYCEEYQIPTFEWESLLISPEETLQQLDTLKKHNDKRKEKEKELERYFSNY